jgi:hypothetical protein
MALAECAAVIEDLVSNGRTYSQISTYFKDNGVLFGSSEANVRKFCRELGINRRNATLGRDEVNAVVGAAIQEVTM